MSYYIKNNHSRISADLLPCLLDKNSQRSSRAVSKLSQPLFKWLLEYYFKVARVQFVGMLGGWRNHRSLQIQQIFKGKTTTFPPSDFGRGAIYEDKERWAPQLELGVIQQKKEWNCSSLVTYLIHSHSRDPKDFLEVFLLTSLLNSII